MLIFVRRTYSGRLHPSVQITTENLCSFVDETRTLTFSMQFILLYEHLLIYMLIQGSGYSETSKQTPSALKITLLQIKANRYV